MRRNITILMIEDNLAILRTNRMALESEGYKVLTSSTLTEGREIANREAPDLILLDIMLPDGSGLDYCREIFGHGESRILFLTAMNTSEDVIEGLRSGGDDYMTKPYILEELLARIEAILRRTKATKPEPKLLCIGLMELNSTSGRAYLSGKDLLLTPKEFYLLEIMLSRLGEFTSSTELYELVWGMQSVDTRSIRQHILKIREKLGKDAPFCIESKQGIGYRIVQVFMEAGKK